MTFCLKILGSGSAVPAYGRNQTAHLLSINNRHYLIDCGEGTQMSLIGNRIKQSRIEAIFISHMHGDHYLGLVGLISSMDLLGRKKPLRIFGPRGLREIITTQLKYSSTVIGFDIDLVELKTEYSKPIYSTPVFTVTSFELNHRVPCWGFVFREKRKPRRINKEKLPADLRIQDILKLKSGKDITDKHGKIIYRNSELTLPPKKSRSYAYCSDTLYDENVVNHIKGVDLLYHESTFLNDKEDIARKTFHSTASQAASIAKMAKAKKLIIGHFSARYKDIEAFGTQACEIFRNTELAIQGKEYCIQE